MQSKSNRADYFRVARSRTDAKSVGPKHRPGREATRRRAMWMQKSLRMRHDYELISCGTLIVSGERMARLLVAKATRPPYRDGRATRAKSKSL
jgi:hypothetical protein